MVVPPLTLVAKALLGALSDPPPLSALALALSWSIGEGAWAAWTEAGVDVYPFAGTNNFGSIHATRGFAAAHATEAGYGMVAFLDHGAGPYVTRMAVYPSLAAGARSYLALVSSFVSLSTVSSASDYSAQLYVHGYFEGFHENRTLLANRAAAYRDNSWSDDDLANIADGAALLSAHLPAAQAALTGAPAELGDPSEASHGPPFAPLGVRLTPAQKWAPHTIAHARQMLGQNAVSPPAGAISLADALASPSGDGVWMFPDGEASAPANPPAAPAEPVARKTVVEVTGVAVALGALAGALVTVAAVKFGWVPSWRHA